MHQSLPVQHHVGMTSESELFPFFPPKYVGGQDEQGWDVPALGAGFGDRQLFLSYHAIFVLFLKQTLFKLLPPGCFTPILISLSL